MAHSRKHPANLRRGASKQMSSPGILVMDHAVPGTMGHRVLMLSPSPQQIWLWSQKDTIKINRMFCFFNLHHPDMPMLKLKLLSERNCFYLSTVFRASIRIVCFTSFFTTCLSHHLAQYMNAFSPTQAQKIIYFFFIKSLSFFFQSSFSCYILILKSDQMHLWIQKGWAPKFVRLPGMLW